MEDLVENSKKIILGEYNAEITKYMYLENAQKISLPYYTLVINLMCYKVSKICAGEFIFGVYPSLK